MTTLQIIEELKTLPESELEKVRAFLAGFQDDKIPASFWQGLREADEGKLIDLQDEHFDQPPV